MALDACEAERAAQAQALRAQLQELAGQDDQPSLVRQYELRLALVWQAVGGCIVAYASGHRRSALACPHSQGIGA